MDLYGISMPDLRTQVVSRESACGAELAWIVARLPVCPVLSASSRSKASPATKWQILRPFTLAKGTHLLVQGFATFAADPLCTIWCLPPPDTKR